MAVEVGVILSLRVPKHPLSLKIDTLRGLRLNILIFLEEYRDTLRQAAPKSTGLAKNTNGWQGPRFSTIKTRLAPLNVNEIG